MTSKNKTRKNRSVYGKEDYNSNDGMLTSVWGPSMWHYLHTMSFNYPVHPTCEQKEQYRDFVLSLKHVLPCGKCRKNLCKNFQKLPLKLKHMENRETFSKYMYKLHELVNTMLGKKSGLTYETIKERYEHFRARCAKSLKHMKKDLRKTIKKAGEKGCTEPLYGEKSKCILRIVPEKEKIKTLDIDEKCIKVREQIE
jgi:Erv1 / Alr family